MVWQDGFLKHFGPGFLGGITLGDWLKLLARNRFRINVRYFFRASTITGMSCINSVLRLAEELRHGHRIRTQEVAPPIFLIGHPRSGTTHLHNLFCVDDRFTYPTLYDITFPHWFLSVRLEPLFEFFVPPRRWLDHVAVSSASPAEDEFALCQTTGLSAVLGGVFPRNRDLYGRYLTFREATESERKSWQQGLVHFVQKLSVADSRPVILKSPDHTARIRLILEAFPEARFVHIRRNPWRVFLSNMKMVKSLADYHGLQRQTGDAAISIVRRYQEMYESFYSDRHLIPSGQFHETSYEQVVRQPVEEMRRIYQALDLHDFGHVETRLCKYLGNIADYRTNRYLDISKEHQSMILRQWSRAFDEWGYPRTPNP